jgi:hypothetical protein
MVIITKYANMMMITIRFAYTGRKGVIDCRCPEQIYVPKNYQFQACLFPAWIEIGMADGSRRSLIQVVLYVLCMLAAGSQSLSLQ